MPSTPPVSAPPVGVQVGAGANPNWSPGVGHLGNGPAGPPNGNGPAGSGPSGAPEANSPAGRGDMAQIIQHTPTIAVADLKPGDALVISGVATGSDNSRILANTLIAGVEPILQAAPAQRAGGRGLGGDWGLGDMAAPQ